MNRDRHRVGAQPVLSRPWSAKLSDLCLFLSVVSLFACGNFPKHGEIHKARLPGGARVEYGVIPPDPADRTHACPAIFALPTTGSQQRKDMVADMDSLWRHEASTRGWVVILPSTGPGLPFHWKDPGAFGYGPERTIGPLVRYVRRHSGFDFKKLNIVEIGRDGVGALAVLRAAPEEFASVTIVPFLGVKTDVLRRAAADFDVPIDVVVSDAEAGGFRKDFSALGLPDGTIEVHGIAMEPLRRTQYDGAVTLMPLLCEVLERRMASAREQ